MTKKTKITNNQSKKTEAERYNLELILDELKQVIKDYDNNIDNEEYIFDDILI